MTMLLPWPIALYLAVGLVLAAIGCVVGEGKLRALRPPRTPMPVLMAGVPLMAATLWPVAMYVAWRARRQVSGLGPRVKPEDDR